MKLPTAKGATAWAAKGLGKGATSLWTWLKKFWKTQMERH
jgi:hypothetical protein